MKFCQPFLLGSKYQCSSFLVWSLHFFLGIKSVSRIGRKTFTSYFFTLQSKCNFHYTSRIGRNQRCKITNNNLMKWTFAYLRGSFAQLNNFSTTGLQSIVVLHDWLHRYNLQASKLSLQGNHQPWHSLWQWLFYMPYFQRQ